MAEQERTDVKAWRADWKHYRQPDMQAEPGGLVFLDETSVKTNMCQLRGRCLCVTRLKASAPFGKLGTQTVIAGLRCSEPTAPWIIEGAMNRAAFEVSISRPSLHPP
ncbi:ISSpo6, transposase orfB [Hyphomonas oceanitis SCH89]|uniref:ISSpo6, transposase orfB n=1 Tax=Hyphomonas oceanitis SCH89 TaxID=1280953 RepID=A0A059G1L1_9PROT|nr:ISSpo6, transposase orfB [Hyphomonas oceanitis SCH89]